MNETLTKPPVKTERKTEAPASEGRHPLEALRRQIDSLFDDFGTAGRLWPFGALSRSAFDIEPLWKRELGWTNLPAMDIVENDKDYQISAELPGIDDKDIDVSLSNGLLLIKGEKKEEKEDKRKDSYLSERRYGSFQRSFRVPENVDVEHIGASFSKGVLTLTLPKKADAPKAEKKIKLNVG